MPQSVTKILVRNIESVNIAEYLTKEELNQIGSDVFTGFQTDERSREAWSRRQALWMKLAMQIMESKSTPWEGAANIKFPLIAMAAMQFHARAYAAVVPGINVVRGRIIGPDSDGKKTDKAKRIGEHMSWQLLENMDGWEEDLDRGLLCEAIIGTIFKKTYFDSSARKNVSELVLPWNLVVNYWAKSLETAPRITHIIYQDANVTQERINEGIYLDVDLATIQKGVADIGSAAAVGDITNNREYNTLNQDSLTLLEQHTWLDLDGDGYKEPYTVLTEYHSGTVLRITARFTAGDVVIDNKGKVVRINPQHYFTKFGFIPSPDGGIYDQGLGDVVGPMNASVNTITNQLVDAGTLSNLRPGLLSRGIKLLKGDMRFSPGELKQTTASGEELQKGVFMLPLAEPSQVLFQLLGTLIQSGQQLTLNDMLLGESPGQNQPATTTMAVMEQGLKVFSAIFRRTYRSLKSEYKKLFILNSKFLVEGEYPDVTSGGAEYTPISREDYNLTEIDIVPFADPGAISQSHKLLKAQSLIEIQAQLGTLNPLEVTKRRLEAEGHENIEALLSNEPPPEDPKIVQARVEFEWKQRLDAWKQEKEVMELDIRRKQVESEGIKDQAVGMLAIAKAQGEEVKNNLSKVTLLLGELKHIMEVSGVSAQLSQPVQPVTQPQPVEAPVDATGNTEAVDGESLNTGVATQPEGGEGQPVQ